MAPVTHASATSFLHGPLHIDADAVPGRDFRHGPSFLVNATHAYSQWFATTPKDNAFLLDENSPAAVLVR